MSYQAWGAPERYYSQKSSGTDAKGGSPEQFTSEDIVRKWDLALREIYPNLEERIARATKNWHQTLRGHLRDETGLKHPASRGRRSLSVTFVPGLPSQLGEILKQFDGKEWLLLGRVRLERGRGGAAFVQRHYEKIQPLFGGILVPAAVGEIENFIRLADELMKKCDVESMEASLRALGEDWLGAYYYYQNRIELYWMAIGILAVRIGVPPESLTVVVLAHELAHAYSHNGRDIGNRTWETGAFADADKNIVEGIAQFYTHVICHVFEERDPSILDAYEGLLRLQGGPYRVHEEWFEWDGKKVGEVLRSGLVGVRTRRIVRFEEFQHLLKDAACP